MLPGILSININVDPKDVIGLFAYHRRSRGPFLLIGRDRGLALDTGGYAADHAPICGLPMQGRVNCGISARPNTGGSTSLCR